MVSRRATWGEGSREHCRALAGVLTDATPALAHPSLLLDPERTRWASQRESMHWPGGKRVRERQVERQASDAEREMARQGERWCDREDSQSGA